jgi:hypothetical protein
LDFLHVVDVFVGLHVNAQVTFGCCRVVTHFAPVRFVATCVHLPSGQTRMRLVRQAVDALSIILWMFLLHMDLQSFLVLVVPVTFRAFQCLA